MSDHPVNTEDLILLRSIDGKLAYVEARLSLITERTQRLETNQPGGRWGVIVERVLIAAVTAMLGYQTVGSRVLGPTETQDPQPAYYEQRMDSLFTPMSPARVNLPQGALVPRLSPIKTSTTP